MVSGLVFMRQRLGMVCRSQSLNNVQRSDASPGPPTQGRAYQKLIQGEMITELAGNHMARDAQFINMGLRVEQKQ
jgi:hypothetical protein